MWEMDKPRLEGWLRKKSSEGNTPKYLQLEPSLIDSRLNVSWLNVGRGSMRAGDAQETPTQSHVPPSILLYEDKCCVCRCGRWTSRCWKAAGSYQNPGLQEHLTHKKQPLTVGSYGGAVSSLHVGPHEPVFADVGDGQTALGRLRAPTRTRGYRNTSLIRITPLLGPYSRTMPNR